MARRGGNPLSSFDRILGRQPGSAGRDEGQPPSMHELFTMAMSDQLPLPQFAEALMEFHGVRLTPAAAKLLSSVDAGSGRLSFSQFQKALQDQGHGRGPQAGLPVHFQDQAQAIIEDNSGMPQAPIAREAGALGKPHTDISNDAFVKASQQISKVQARGAFSGNVVRPTNEASPGNPFTSLGDATYADLPENVDMKEDPYGVRDMSRTATRMFVSGEINRQGYEKFLTRLGLVPAPESDLRKLIISHERTGDGSFAALSRALTTEMARAGLGGS